MELNISTALTNKRQALEKMFLSQAKIKREEVIESNIGERFKESGEPFSCIALKISAKRLIYVLGLISAMIGSSGAIDGNNFKFISLFRIFFCDSCTLKAAFRAFVKKSELFDIIARVDAIS